MDLSALTPSEQEELIHLLEHHPPESLADFVPWASPTYVSPIHLQPLIDELERSRREPIRLLVSSPPRHGKTELLLHYIAWLLAHDPTEQVAYITHTSRLAKMKSGKARSIAKSCGVPISDESHSKSDWRTGVGEGGLWATSTGTPIAGIGFSKLIIDDPVKGRRSVESALQRENDWEWFNGDAFNRLEPTASIIINMARWHDDDMIGRLVKAGWQYINLPAINPQGMPLWPERWPIDRLMEIKARSEYDWVSLFMGQPRPREGKLFNGITTYRTLPAQGLRYAIGCDLAYTAKTSADWSVAVVLGEYDGKWYLIDVVRRQCRADDFADELLKLQSRYPTAPMTWYGSTTELGSADLLRKLGVHISGRLATADKFVRAQPVAASWKAGKVFVPATAALTGMDAEALEEFCRVVTNFSGIGDIEDDDVDALAAAYDLLPALAVQHEPAVGSQEWYHREEARMRTAAEQRARPPKQTPWDPYGGRR